MLRLLSWEESVFESAPQEQGEMLCAVLQKAHRALQAYRHNHALQKDDSKDAE